MSSRSVRKFKETNEIRSLLFKRIQSHRYTPIALIATAILLAACVHVWQRVVVIRLVREVSIMQREHAELVDDAQKVQSKIAALSMSARVESYAVDSLGLRPVAPDQLYTLVPEASGEIRGDELATVMSSIRRVAEYLPVLSETRAEARELQPLKFESRSDGGDSL